MNAVEEKKRVEAIKLYSLRKQMKWGWGGEGRGMLSRKMLSRSCNSYAEKKQLPQNLSTDYMN